MASVDITSVLSLPVDERSEALCSIKEDQWFERKAVQTDLKDIAKAFIGMANAEGGVVVIGVRERKIEDLSTQTEKLNRIRQLAFNMIAPPLRVEFDEVATRKTDGSPTQTLVAHIQPSTSCHRRMDGKAFLRVGDSTIELNHAQWMELFYERSPHSYEAERVEGASIDSLDSALLSEFKNRIGAQGGTEALLRSRGLLTPAGEVTVAALLLFGKYPQEFLPQATVRVLRYLSNDAGYGEYQTLAEDGDRRIDGPLPYQLHEVQKQLDDWVPRARQLQEDATFGSKETVIPRSVWQEAVVNAITHRSYSMAGDHIRISVFPNRIEVISPGVFPGGVTSKDLAFPLSLPRYARNPRIARVLSDFDITQELGEGIQRMVMRMRKAELADPVFRQHGGKVKVRLDASSRLMGELLRDLPKDAPRIVAILLESGGLGTGDIATALGISRPAALRGLNALQDRKIVERRGRSAKDPRATWHILGG